MQIDPPLLTPGWRLATSVLGCGVVAWAAIGAPWRAWLLGRSDRQHVWLGGIVLLVLLWSMRAGITPGLSFQFLLVAALTLVHGARLALVAIALVLAALAFVEGRWSAWGANLLCFGLVPVALVAALHRTVQRRLPHNYFVYFFVTVFAGSMLAFNAAGLARLALLAANGTLPASRLAGEYWLYLPMLSFAEAFMNGVVMAMLIVYRPEWVASFDDRTYLGR